MVKNIYGKKSLDMEFSEIKDFAVAPKVDKKGIKGKVNLAIATVRDTLFAKFNQVVHKFVSGEWINDEKIRQTLLKNIEDLKKPKQTSLDNPEAEEEIIKNTIKEIRLICDYLQKKGVPKDRVNTVRGKLTELSSKEDLESRRTTELGVAEEEEEEEGVLIPETEEDKLPEENVTRSELREVEEEEEIDLSRLEDSEKRPALAKEVNQIFRLSRTEIISLRKGGILPENEVIPTDHYIEISLRQNNKDYRRFLEIEEQAKNGFKGLKPAEIRDSIDEFIRLLRKGLTQKINTKVEIKDQGRAIKIPVAKPKRDLPPQIQKAIDGLEMDKEYISERI